MTKKNKNDVMYGLNSSSPLIKDKSRVHFNYSNLLLGLLLVQLSVQASAHAKLFDSDSNNTTDNITSTSSVQDNSVNSQNIDEETALVALKLKQAVEKGLIDESVLEDYKRENFSSSNGIQQSAFDTNEMAHTDTPNLVSSNSASDHVVMDRTNQDDDTASGHLSEESFEQNFNRVFNDTSFIEEINNSYIDFDEDVSIESPLQIEQDLAQVEPSVDTNFDVEVAMLGSKENPLGYNPQVDKTASFNPNNRDTLGLENLDEKNVANEVISTRQSQPVKTNTAITNAVNSINPDEYLPEYGKTNNNIANEAQIDDIEADEEEPAKPNIFKKLYNNLFNDGYEALPKISATIYEFDSNKINVHGTFAMVKADEDSQPAHNIKAAMENISVESISDFTAAKPKLIEAAKNAAEAVGYYDIEFSFEKESSNKIKVIIDRLGEPVRVSSRLIDIRGDGAKLPEFEAIVENAKPQEGDIFNHGEYKNTKAEIYENQQRFGLFDSRWLNQSVDVVLPDNTADIGLIVDTGERYRFDEVIFFTIDEETGQITSDPDKLPVKPELLRQLYTFRKGDAFYQPKVTEFTNNLSATEYFNTVNVELIKPNIEGINRANLEFDNQADVSNNPPNNAAKTSIDIDNIDMSASETADGIDIAKANAVNNTQLDVVGELDLDDEIEPIDFSVDQETNERLLAIKNKVQRLNELPDDRVLEEVAEEPKSFLGKISNSISNAVQRILPDDETIDYARLEQIEDEDSTISFVETTTPEEVQQTKSVPLYVFVMADKPRDVDLGIGYGTDTGARAVARFEHNLINRDGYQAGINIGVSKIDKSVSIDASRPWRHPLNDTLNGNLSYQQEVINQGEGNLDLTTHTLKAGIARNIKKESGWNRTYSLRYQLDDLETGLKGVDYEKLPSPFNIKGSSFTQQALLLGYGLDRTSSDNVANPSKGWHQYYSISAGSKQLVTDTNMIIARAGVNGVYSFGENKRHQLVGSLDGGYIWAENFDNVPYKLRFFAGGDRSIRGYDYNSLSTLENGYLSGGQVLAVGSTEYNYEFKPGLRGAVFADFGNAYDKNFETETKLGVGFGVRWLSPVGIVRLDLAAGVLEDSIPIRLHFFIGSPLQ